jgi:hypothetical protein
MPFPEIDDFTEQDVLEANRKCYYQGKCIRNWNCKKLHREVKERLELSTILIFLNVFRQICASRISSGSEKLPGK